MNTSILSRVVRAFAVLTVVSFSTHCFPGDDSDDTDTGGSGVCSSLSAADAMHSIEEGESATGTVTVDTNLGFLAISAQGAAIASFASEPVAGVLGTHNYNVTCTKAGPGAVVLSHSGNPAADNCSLTVDVDCTEKVAGIASFSITGTSFDDLTDEVVVTINVHLDEAAGLKNFAFTLIGDPTEEQVRADRGSLVTPWDTGSVNQDVTIINDNSHEVVVRYLALDQDAGDQLEAGDYTIEVRFHYVREAAHTIQLKPMSIKVGASGGGTNITGGLGPVVPQDIPAASKVATVSKRAESATSWTLSTTAVPVLDVDINGTADVHCSAAYLENQSELTDTTNGLTGCQLDLIEGEPNSETVTNISSNLLPQGRGIDLTLTGTAAHLRLSCASSATALGSAAVSLGIVCDSENRTVFHTSPVGGTPQDLPSYAESVLTNASAAPIPRANHLYVDLLTNTDPEILGEFVWMAKIDGRYLRRGALNEQCSAGSGYQHECGGVRIGALFLQDRAGFLRNGDIEVCLGSGSTNDAIETTFGCALVERD